MFFNHQLINYHGQLPIFQLTIIQIVSTEQLPTDKNNQPTKPNNQLRIDQLFVKKTNNRPTTI